MQVDFPVICTDEMELFYGERNAENNMNWKRAGVNLMPLQEESLLSDSGMAENDFAAKVGLFMNELKLYQNIG